MIDAFRNVLMLLPSQPSNPDYNDFLDKCREYSYEPPLNAPKPPYPEVKLQVRSPIRYRNLLKVCVFRVYLINFERTIFGDNYCIISLVDGEAIVGIVGKRDEMLGENVLKDPCYDTVNTCVKVAIEIAHPRKVDENCSSKATTKNATTWKLFQFDSRSLFPSMGATNI